jgi:FMN phosphatase YigB (HAD superfamily)
MAGMLRFVFFDVGSTLLLANRERMLAPLHERKIVPSEQQLRALESEVTNQFEDILEHNGKADHGFWDMFYTRLFENLRLHGEPLRKRVIANTRDSSNWDRIRPGTREALQRIGHKIPDCCHIECRRQDCRIAGTSRYRGLLPDHHRFWHRGAREAASRHFETALASVGAPAQESLYLGDLYSVDYRGATRAGMEAVLFDVCGAYREKGWPRVESLEGLVERIG